MSAATLVRIAAGCVVLASSIVGLTAERSGEAAAQAQQRVAYVTVVDEQTLQPVRDLSPDAIVVREDGVRREVLEVTPATSSMPVAVIVDNSQAAAETIPHLRRAVTTFLEAIDGLGPVGLFTIADRPTVLQSYTTERQPLLDAANRLFAAPGSGATLLDSIADVANGLARREADRAAIVVVATENVEFSNLHYRDVLERLENSGAMLFALVLTNPDASLLSEEARNRATVLDRGPKESGGFRTDVLTSMAYEPRLATIAAMLTAQHRVTYARPEALIPPDTFEVSAAAPGLRAFGAPARGQERK